jgi:hypothetical protein
MKKYYTSHHGFELETPASTANILSLDHQSKIQIYISSIHMYQGLSFLPVTLTGLADLFPQLESSHEQLCED